MTAGRPNAHRGLDFAVRKNSWIPAVTSGTVLMNTWSDVLGWVVVHSGWDHKENRTVYVGYSHLKRRSKLQLNQKIEKGSGIGIQGNTGTASRGDHLHLTIGPTVRHIFVGVTFDPEKFIKEMIEETNAL